MDARTAMRHGDHPKHPYIPRLLDFWLDTFLDLDKIIKKETVNTHTVQ